MHLVQCMQNLRYYFGGWVGRGSDNASLFLQDKVFGNKDILSIILSFLNAHDLVHCLFVNKRWQHTIVKNIWRYVVPTTTNTTIFIFDDENGNKCKCIMFPGGFRNLIMECEKKVQHIYKCKYCEYIQNLKYELQQSHKSYLKKFWLEFVACMAICVCVMGFRWMNF